MATILLRSNLFENEQWNWSSFIVSVRPRDEIEKRVRRIKKGLFELKRRWRCSARGDLMNQWKPCLGWHQINNHQKQPKYNKAKIVLSRCVSLLWKIAGRWTLHRISVPVPFWIPSSTNHPSKLTISRLHPRRITWHFGCPSFRIIRR